MPDWEADAELKALREEFLDSLKSKLLELRQIERALGEKSASSLDDLHVLVHKLAGAAGSYGLPALSELSGAFDDWMAESIGTRTAKTDAAQVRGALKRVAVLGRALEEALTCRGDCPKTLTDPRSCALSPTGARG